MNKLLPIFALLLLLCSCKNDKKIVNKLLKNSILNEQLVTIDITKDNTFRTKNGAIITIPRNAIKITSLQLQLIIKEAFVIEDIVKAGLTTSSNRHPLSSGGMIYINTKNGQPISIIKPISIAIPTNYINKKMQLFKGVENEDGNINWVDPKPLNKNPQTTLIEAGEVLFKEQCSSCHLIGKDEANGPDLAHVVKRYQKMFENEKSIYTFTDSNTINKSINERILELLYRYTRDNKMQKRADFVELPAATYFRCLEKKWGVTMTRFPTLNDSTLHQLYSYIENESERKGLPIPSSYIKNCIDSCSIYGRLKDSLEEVQKNNKKDSIKFSIIKPTNVTAPILNASQKNNTAIQPANLDIPKRVTSFESKSLYYQFNIETTGWYNVDILLGENPEHIKSDLLVSLPERYKNGCNVYLIIPSEKVFAQGGLANDMKNGIAFADPNGTIYLPQGVKAFIFATGEHNGQLLFSKKDFITSTQQQINIQPELISKEIFEQNIRSIKFNDINMSISETKNANKLREIADKLKNTEQLKPKNCDCNCGQLFPQPATAATEMYYSK